MTRKSVCDMIVESVIEQIRNHTLNPGDKLPNENDMAAEYGVSRISLREALRVLTAKGLITTKHGEGSFVNTYNPKLLADMFANISLLSPAPLLEMLQLRKIMETESVKLCCENASENDIQEIRLHKELHEEYCTKEETEENTEEKYEQDRLFHISIAKATHNSLFVQFMETIHETIALHQRASYQPEQVKQTLYYHNAILEAIEKRDAELAAQMMDKHLTQVGESILAVISGNHS